MTVDILVGTGLPGGRTLTVEMAFGAAPDGDPAGWSWTDITAYVVVETPIIINRGRIDESSSVGPSSLSMQVHNSDGRFTPRSTLGAYYPNVKLRVPVRVRVGSSTRFSGFVDEWPIEWPGGVETWSTASVKASGRWRRLAQSPPFKSTAEELLTYLNPSTYYPMTDGPSAIAWADRSRNGRPDVPVAAWTPGGMDFTSLNTDQSNGGVDRKTAAFYPSTLPLPVNGPVSVPFVGHTPNAGASFFYYCMGFGGEQIVAELYDTAGAIWRIRFVSSVLTLQRVVGVTVTTVTSIGATTPNPVLINWVQSGSNVSVTLWSPIANATAVVNSISVPTILSAVLYDVTNPFTAEVFAGHVALYDDAMTADELTLIGNAMLWGIIADPTEANAIYNPEGIIRSRARLAGYRDSAIVLNSSAALLDFASADAVLGGRGRVDAMRVAADGALGLLYETLDGGVGYRNLSSRYVTSPWLTVDIDLNDVAAPPSPTFDDANVINDATVTRRQGQGRYVDQASVDDIGVFDKSVPSIGFQSDTYSSDFSATQQAAWIVNTHKDVRVRVPQIRLRLSNRAATADGWVASEPLGSWLRVLNMPPQFSDTTLDQFVEGYTETISMFEWLVDANLSPVDPYNRLWKVEGTANQGRLELDGQTLAASYSTTATSWSVATTAGLPLLITTATQPGMFPFDLEVGGEQVTVTAITGASSPQTLTVTRSVNGVVKAQASGAVLKLYRPGVIRVA